MKTLITLCLSLMMIGPVSVLTAEQHAGDFSLFDQRGDYHQMSRYNNRRATTVEDMNWVPSVVTVARREWAPSLQGCLHGVSQK